MYTSPPEKSGILHFLHWSQMSDSGFLSEENEGDVSLHFPTVFSDAEVGAPEPSIEERMKAESAKLAALQAEIIA